MARRNNNRPFKMVHEKGIDRNDAAGKYLSKSKKKKAKEKDIRARLLKRYGMNEHTSSILLAEKVCEEVGIPSPENKLQCLKIINRIGRNILKEEKPERERWKGKKTPSEEFFKSNKWKELRYIALRNSEGKCNLCGAGASDGVQIHVDHIKPRSKYPDLEYDLDNLQVLCADCNYGKTNAFDDDWRGLDILH